ncbi:hypothetical protein Poli38472_003099 [Pythium oligandrum]|uniref:Serine/threonine-protein phosphatase 4 regulatory subunit 3-like central domain-containing protein n=1 Tax=Pythium oligandrum TaxID=41045 RepID=A0A8K1C5X2_PYTOL|nr:hypothetical protein Poli38472_003099 [Pythium oligandrum]|eukprot:TMW57174.1 hypothetical protein Poli38472_003099 [Pythium oligandrum]
MEDALMAFFPEDIKGRELPPCDVEHLDDILVLLKSSHPTIRSKLLRDLAGDNGEYIVKLLNLFDVCEMEPEKEVMHRLFDIFYALVELCDRRIIEILFSEQNFLSVVGVFGYNPGLIREMDFRADLEKQSGFKEVIPIKDRAVLERIHMNFRIHVIKDNVLSRSLPDCSVIMLDHMVNENNFNILSYVSDSEEYWQSIKELIQKPETRLDGLGLLKEIIQLVRVTRPLDKLPQLRRDGFGAPPVFGTLINNLFGDGAIFESFSVVLGASDSKTKEIELALDILNTLVFYQGPERLRTHLASEGKCIAPPTSEKERIAWKPGSSLFTALIYVFERYEPTRVQIFTLLKEIFKVSLPQDDKFLNVLYPNYIHWLLQPLKYTSADEITGLFALQDSIMELLTFCTEAHGYRVKYLFGRQPIASYVERMLRSRNKLFVIHAVKFMRACAARGEAFFSRYLIQNDLLNPMLSRLDRRQPNGDAVTSAILEFLAFVEKSNLTALVEHIHTKFYETYKAECPIVFESIRLRYEDTHGSSSMMSDADEANKITFIQERAVDEEEERYWEKDDEPATTFVGPSDTKETLAESEVRFQPSEPMKIVDYADDDEPISPLKEGDVQDRISPSLSRDAAAKLDISEKSAEDGDVVMEEELKLPVRVKKDEDNGENFLAGALKHQAKKAKSPHYKSMFQQISWKVGSPNGEKSPSKSTRSDNPSSDEESNSPSRAHSNSNGDSNDSSPLVSKRKLEVEATPSPDSILKKAKPCTPLCHHVGKKIINCGIFGRRFVALVEVDLEGRVQDLADAIAKALDTTEVPVFFLARNEDGTWLQVGKEVQQLLDRKRDYNYEELLDKKRPLRDYFGSEFEPHLLDVPVVVELIDLWRISEGDEAQSLTKVYRSAAEMLKHSDDIKSILRLIDAVASTPDDEAKPFIALESSFGLGKTQTAFTLMGCDDLDVFYIVTQKPFEGRWDKPVYRATATCATVYYHRIARDVKAAPDKTVEEILANEYLHVYGFLSAILTGKTSWAMLRGSKSDVIDAIKARTKPFVFFLDEFPRISKSKMKDLDRIYLIMRDVLRAFGFVVILSSTNEMARTLFTPDTLARARDGQTWCHIVPTFARLQAPSSAAIPPVLREILQRSHPLFAQAALAFLRDNPFVAGDSVVDFMDGLAEAIMRGCKEWRFLTTDGFRSGQVCLFLSSRHFDDHKSLLIHDHFANLTETTPFKLQFAHEGTLVKEGEHTPWVSQSVFPPVEEDVLLYLCLMGGKSSRSLVTKHGKTLTFEEIMDLMDEDPDNPAIYDQEPQVDPIPFQEALTEAENMNTRSSTSRIRIIRRTT